MVTRSKRGAVLPAKANGEAQTAFISRGLKAAEAARQTGIYHPAEAVHDELQRRVDARRKLVLG